MERKKGITDFCFARDAMAMIIRAVLLLLGVFWSMVDDADIQVTRRQQLSRTWSLHQHSYWVKQWNDPKSNAPHVEIYSLASLIMKQIIPSAVAARNYYWQAQYFFQRLAQKFRWAFLTDLLFDALIKLAFPLLPHGMFALPVVIIQFFQHPVACGNTRKLWRTSANAPNTAGVHTWLVNWSITGSCLSLDHDVTFCQITYMT